jgi:hypothetical protein
MSVVAKLIRKGRYIIKKKNSHKWPQVVRSRERITRWSLAQGIAMQSNEAKSLFQKYILRFGVNPSAKIQSTP